MSSPVTIPVDQLLTKTLLKVSWVLSGSPITQYVAFIHWTRTLDTQTDVKVYGIRKSHLTVLWLCVQKSSIILENFSQVNNIRYVE
jgi:hypothetical protein